MDFPVWKQRSNMNKFYFLSLILHGFWGNEPVRLLRYTFVINMIAYWFLATLYVVSCVLHCKSLPILKIVYFHVFSESLQSSENRETKLFILKFNFKKIFLIDPESNIFLWKRQKQSHKRTWMCCVKLFIHVSRLSAARTEFLENLIDTCTGKFSCFLGIEIFVIVFHRGHNGTAFRAR
jgi:hypothetical protein